MTTVQRKRAEIEAERQLLLTRLAGLDAKLALLAELESPPLGKPTPRLANQPAGGGKRGMSLAAEDARLELVRLLAKHPAGLSLTQLTAMTRKPMPTVLFRLRHQWFAKLDARNRLSPWVLTDAGKAVAARDHLD